MISSQLPVSQPSVAPPVAPSPAVETVVRREPELEQQGATVEVSHANVDGLSANEDSAQPSVNLSSEKDLDSIRLEEAATKAQAAFRGYLVIFFLLNCFSGCFFFIVHLSASFSTSCSDSRSHCRFYVAEI